MIYLASPYSHTDAAVREKRYRDVSQLTASLLRAGVTVFSPVTYSHPLVAFGLPSSWSFWEQHDRCFLECADELLVLALPGWEKSQGVQAEMQIAMELGKPVRILSAEEALLWSALTYSSRRKLQRGN